MGKFKDRRQHGFESLGNILQDTLRPFKNEFDDKLGLLVQKWPQIAGDTLAAHCLPFAIKEARLFIKVDSAAWMHHLQFFKDDLIVKVNAFMQTEQVTEIHFKVKDMA